MQIPGGITYLRKISCVFLRLLLQWFSIIVCYYLQPLLYSVLPYGVLRCLAVSCHVMSSCCGIMCRTCHVVSCHAISFRVSLSLREVSCSAASCIVLFLCHDVLCRAVCCCVMQQVLSLIIAPIPFPHFCQIGFLQTSVPGRKDLFRWWRRSLLFLFES